MLLIYSYCTFLQSVEAILVHCTHRLLSKLARILCKRRIIFSRPPAFAVIVATRARRFKTDGRRGCRCDAKKRNCGNRERFTRHCGPFISFCHCRVERKRGWSKGWISRKRRVSRLWPYVRLKSYIRLSGSGGKSLVDYVTRRFNASSVGVKTGWGA